MWTRSELKQYAKTVLRGSYWETVAAVLIVGAISGAAGLVGAVIPFWGSIAVTLFLSLPLSVGLNFFLMQNQIAPPRIQNVFFPFEGGRFMKIVGAMAWMYLFVVLWSLIASAGFIIVLFKWIAALMPFIPSGLYKYPSDMYSFLYGIWESFRFDSSWIPILIACGVIYVAGMVIATVKSLSYSMVPYILTDNPAIGYSRALKLSIAMTHGHKWRMFVLGLSFIGWGLLALLTLGIGFLFLAPYVSATQAQLYSALRDRAISGGLVTAQELNVTRINLTYGGQHMITVVAHNYVKPGCRDAFLAAAKVLEEETNKLDAGCVSYAMYENLSDPLVVTCIEEWESREAQENHLKTEHFMKSVQALLPNCARPTDAVLYSKLF